MSSRYVPERLSMGGLMYCLRHFNRTVAPYWKRLNTRDNYFARGDITPLVPYLQYFNFYNTVNTDLSNDWQRILKLHLNNVYKNKSNFICSFRDNMMDDIYSTFYNGYNDYFNNAHSYDDIHECAREVITTMKINIDKYLDKREDKEAMSDGLRYFNCYESIQLDNNEIYNLRLVYIPEGRRTSIHNHGGVCFYKMLNHYIDIAVSETKYVGYAHNNKNTDTRERGTGRSEVQHGHMNKNSVIINDGKLNVLFTDEYHEIESIAGDACMLNLYFHDVNIKSADYTHNVQENNIAIFGNRRHYSV